MKMIGGWKKKEKNYVSEIITSKWDLPPPNSCRGNTEEAEIESGISWQRGNAVDSLWIMKTKQQLHIKTAFFFENCNTTNLSCWCTARSPAGLPAELCCFIDMFFSSVHNTARHNTAEETSISCNVENSFHKSLLQFVRVMQQQRLILEKSQRSLSLSYNSLILWHGFGYHVF